MIEFSRKNSCEIIPSFLPHYFAGKGRRIAREDEVSDAQLLGINDRELNSMNKHIPGRATYVDMYISDCYNSSSFLPVHNHKVTRFLFHLHGGLTKRNGVEVRHRPLR